MSSAASRPPFSDNQSLSQTAASQTAASQTAASQTAGLAATSSTQVSSMQSSTPSASSASEPHPPKRPQLMGPPARPKPPKPAPAPETPPAAQKPPEPETPKLIGPISRPSERMQYRAIGLLKGKYVASEERFNRGDILLADGTLIDSVLLGRVTSLIQKHIDLETEHLWVVYPRTLYKEEDNEPALHMQIVGVWEPETLSASKGSGSASTADASADGTADANPQAPRYLSTEEATEQCDRFSIRGEIAKYSDETNEITINIVQKSKSENVKPKRPFKLLINGQLEGRTTGYFWDLEVKREGGQLVLEEAAQVGVVPPKKKSKEVRRGGDRKRSPGKPRSGSSAPKPMPKKKQLEATETKPAEAKPAETAQVAKATSTPAIADVKVVDTNSIQANSTQANSTQTKSTGTKSADSSAIDAKTTDESSPAAQNAEINPSSKTDQPTDQSTGQSTDQPETTAADSVSAAVKSSQAPASD